MKSNELKQRFASELNVKPSALAVRTIPSTRADKWVEIRIRPDAASLHKHGLSYTAQFSELHRRIALAIVHGVDFARGQAVGGNVQLHSISLFESQWVRFCETMAAVYTCCAGDSESKLAVAFSYLNTRNAVAAAV